MMPTIIRHTIHVMYTIRTAIICCTILYTILYYTLGIIHAGIGKISFTPEQILDNIRAFMIALNDSKPEGYKGWCIYICVFVIYVRVCSL